MTAIRARVFAFALVMAGAIAGRGAERINHEGRILGPLLVVTNATLFNTPESDAIIASMQIFPTDSAWNEDISQRPLLSNSATMITFITNSLSASRQTLRAFSEMNWALVPDAQPPVPIDFTVYGDESDPSPYPIPTNMPVETWPVGTSNLTLAQWQADIHDEGGDRHAIIVQPGTGGLWETWQARFLTNSTSGTNWEASNGAKFDMNSNNLRPTNWTSADAAGLSMFAGLVRYDECERGMVEHAIRLIVRYTRREYIYPARHYASATNFPYIPAMGQRLRLKSGFIIPAGWTKQEKAVALALKKYGAIIADNGGFFSISVAPDNRFPSNCFANFQVSLAITNFEVIQTTDVNEGPRSAGRPSVDAGPDLAIDFGDTAALAGAVMWTNNAPAIRWRLYSGPGSATFGDATNAATTATFGAPGLYTLMLSASNGVHPVAYDATVIAVRPVISNITATAGSVTLRWAGGTVPSFIVEKTTNLAPANWTAIQTNATTNLTIPITTTEAAFFRLRTP